MAGAVLWSQAERLCLCLTAQKQRRGEGGQASECGAWGGDSTRTSNFLSAE